MLGAFCSMGQQVPIPMGGSYYTLSSYTLSRKKQKMFNNIMFGALGNTWRHKFYMGMQNAMNLEK